MSSSLLTVLVLAVLWLVVVVPMLVRRKDERAPERSVARFGRAMRALTRRGSLHDEALAPRSVDGAAADDADWVTPRSAPVESQVFVPGRPSSTHVPSAARRPVPAAREALMYPVDRTEMSAARRQMMARRRRSLTILGLGLFITLLAAFIAGGWLPWSLALIFLAATAGYLLFLRSQALKDRDRRESRLRRAERLSAAEWDATADADLETDDDAGVAPHAFRPPVETVVRIDDDDLELQIMDTVDLTGLYSGAELADEPIQRRAG
jgi:hypothetical protein